MQCVAVDIWERESNRGRWNEIGIGNLDLNLDLKVPKLERWTVRPCNLNCSREKDLSQYLRVYSRARPSIDSIWWEYPGSDPEVRVGFRRELVWAFSFLVLGSDLWYYYRGIKRNLDCGEGTCGTCERDGAVCTSLCQVRRRTSLCRRLVHYCVLEGKTIMHTMNFFILLSQFCKFPRVFFSIYI